MFKIRKKKIRTEPVMDRDIVDSLARAALKLEQKGHEIADDCVINRLRRGESLALSEITGFIHARYSARPKDVENGFLKRMLEYMGSDEIRRVGHESDGLVFVHTDHWRPNTPGPTAG